MLTFIAHFNIFEPDIPEQVTKLNINSLIFI